MISSPLRDRNLKLAHINNFLKPLPSPLLEGEGTSNINFIKVFNW